jgi:hypothetical protein
MVVLSVRLPQIFLNFIRFDRLNCQFNFGICDCRHRGNAADGANTPLDKPLFHPYISAEQNIGGIFMPLYLNAEQIPATKKAFSDAEALVARQFRLSHEQLRKNKYEVKTLAYLKEHEIQDGTFAHLCKYTFGKPGEALAEQEGGFDFYRICLQDNTILSAVKRANPFIKFGPLMLYIAVHELIHILRFNSGEADFFAGDDEKGKEEIIVHHMTRTSLQPVKNSDLDIVLDCFNSNFKNIL